MADMKVIVMDGAFDGMDQDDIDEVMEALNKALESGELFVESEEVDLEQMAIDEPELHAKLVEQLELLDMHKSRTLH